ncbi:hypothetical protein GA0070613_6151 [Micromonospora inositola]|uniref:Uncharacterized protein n=1 Tax=Micromonospora inositola TaxID=47865 RepID=A0A1C5K2S3_9ACTN|nr:hypothetical protein GA0070613_6151 [Micromonospora inositola]
MVRSLDEFARVASVPGGEGLAPSVDRLALNGERPVWRPTA